MMLGERTADSDLGLTEEQRLGSVSHLRGRDTGNAALRSTVRSPRTNRIRWAYRRSFYRRKDGRWEGRIYGPLVNGQRRIYATVYGHSLTAAKAKARERIAALPDPEPPLPRTYVRRAHTRPIMVEVQRRRDPGPVFKTRSSLDWLCAYVLDHYAETDPDLLKHVRDARQERADFEQSLDEAIHTMMTVQEQANRDRERDRAETVRWRRIATKVGAQLFLAGEIGKDIPVEVQPMSTKIATLRANTTADDLYAPEVYVRMQLLQKTYPTLLPEEREHIARVLVYSAHVDRWLTQGEQFPDGVSGPQFAFGTSFLLREGARNLSRLARTATKSVEVQA